MTNSSLVVIEDTPYSVTVRQDQINSLGDALMSYHPEAQKAGVAVMRNVAALALATGANPLPGGLNGIHVWDNKGKIAVSLGEGFWSGLTKNYGGVVWMFQPRPMTEQERKDWAVMPGDIAFICAGCLGHHLRDHIRESVNSGIPITRAEAKEELCQYGTAVVKQADYEKAGRSRGWTAGKRAEVALFKKLVPAGAINQNRRVAPDGRVLGGEGWDVAEFVKPTLPANTENKTVDEINGELYGETPTETDGETIIGEDVTMPKPVTIVDQVTGEIKTNQKTFHAVGVSLCGMAAAWDQFRPKMVAKMLKEEYTVFGDFSANRLSQEQINKAVELMNDAARLATEKPASLVKHLTERLFLDAGFASEYAENLFKAHTKIDLQKACKAALEYSPDVPMSLMAYADNGDAENDPMNF